MLSHKEVDNVEIYYKASLINIIGFEGSVTSSVNTSVNIFFLLDNFITVNGSTS